MANQPRATRIAPVADLVMLIQSSRRCGRSLSVNVMKAALYITVLIVSDIAVAPSVLWKVLRVVETVGDREVGDKHFFTKGPQYGSSRGL